AHRDFTDTTRCNLRCRYVNRIEKINEAVRGRFDQHDLGIRRHGVRPLDIKRSLLSPATISLGLGAGGKYFFETAIRGGAGGKPELLREDVKIVFRGRIVERVNNCHRSRSASRG